MALATVLLALMFSRWCFIPGVPLLEFQFSEGIGLQVLSTPLIEARELQLLTGSIGRKEMNYTKTIQVCRFEAKAKLVSH